MARKVMFWNLLPGGALLRIKGKNVSFDADDEAQGIFLVASDKTEIRVASYNRIGSSVVEAYIPSGTAAALMK